ncbi:MAG: RluA family pseudouridine synthase [Alphaproteobacteria bacterium]
MSEKLNFPRKPPPPFDYIPPDTPLEIIFKDDHLLVLSKPSGLLSVPGRKEEHQDCLINRVQLEYPNARTVHRLDMDTSGVVIMAMNSNSHRNLGLQFEKRKTKKEYIARIWGDIEGENGHIDLPLICDWPNRPLQKIDLTRGKDARTDWKVLEREEDGKFTRVSLSPITGRTHQLRVHMAEIGHPILGDDFYAHERAFKAESRLQLHAKSLMVYHPEDRREMWFEAPCPF